MSTAEEQPGTKAAEPVPMTVPLPAIETALDPSAIVAKLDQASRRGRLPGFSRGAGEGTFLVEAAGGPFDRMLVASVEAAGSGRWVVRFRSELLKKMPAVFAAVLVTTVWPGVYFMDELIAQYLPGIWKPWVTYYWYLPLTIVPLPFVWRGLMRKSNAAAHDSGHKSIELIAREIGGTVVSEG